MRSTADSPPSSFPSCGSSSLRSPRTWGAGELDRDATYVDPTIAGITNRAWNVSDEATTKDLVEKTLEERLDDWSHEAGVAGRTLGYRKDKTTVPLLQSPSVDDWTPFTLLNSLRDVEPNVALLHFERSSPAEPSWAAPPTPAETE